MTVAADRAALADLRARYLNEHEVCSNCGKDWADWACSMSHAQLRGVLGIKGWHDQQGLCPDHCDCEARALAERLSVLSREPHP